jgi:hypothetical protein
MSFVVTQVSRGDVRLTDGARTVRVLGEGLLPPTPHDPSFVVYLNSFEAKDAGGAVVQMDDETRKEVVEAIKVHFIKQGSVVDFE